MLYLEVKEFLGVRYFISPFDMYASMMGEMMISKKRAKEILYMLGDAKACKEEEGVSRCW